MPELIYNISHIQFYINLLSSLKLHWQNYYIFMREISIRNELNIYQKYIILLEIKIRRTILKFFLKHFHFQDRYIISKYIWNIYEIIFIHSLSSFQNIL